MKERKSRPDAGGNQLVLWQICPDLEGGRQVETSLAEFGQPGCLQVVTGLAEGLERQKEMAPGDLVFVHVPQGNIEAGCEALRAWQKQRQPIPALVVSDIDSEEQALRLIEAGAADFLCTPLRKGELVARLARWLPPVSEVSAATRALQAELALAEIVGRSAAIRAEMRKAQQYAPRLATVLIMGETGTGKEIFARAIHGAGPRRGAPFVPVNCAALPVELVENELFGHESGAFTGARREHPGLIFEAEGGTLFLDEVDSLPAPAQAKLLRFLQAREYRRLGASQNRQADVRVISASNADLPKCVRAGRFREDLYFRLNVLSLTLPPLRERPEDIPELAVYLLRRHSEAEGLRSRGFSAEAVAKLMQHDWPGNVRELENVIERALAFSWGRTIEAASVDLPEVNPATPTEKSFKEQKSRAVQTFERRYLREILARHEGNITRAAKAANKNRRAFFELLKKHQLLGSWDSPDERPRA